MFARQRYLAALIGGVLLGAAPAGAMPPRTTAALSLAPVRQDRAPLTREAIALPKAPLAQRQSREILSERLGEEPEPPPLGEEPEPPPLGEEPEPPPLDITPRFLGQPDDDILDRMCQRPLRSLRPLGGGASISLRADFEGGARAALKPAQKHVTLYRSEIAAYRVARALGLGVVPPSCVRRYPAAVLKRGMPQRLLRRMERELLVDRDGTVGVAVIHWVRGLRGLHLEKERWYWPLLVRGARVPEWRRQRLRDLSTLLLFDFLILNGDRWSGGNTHAVGARMVYIDQGAGFVAGGRRRHRKALRALTRCERFDREVVEALMALDVGALRRELAGLLGRGEVADLAERIEAARRYLRGLARLSGDSMYL